MLLDAGPNEDIIYNGGAASDPFSKAGYPSNPSSTSSRLPRARDGSFTKFTELGPKANLTGTPNGTNMKETGSSIADSSSPGAPIASSSVRAYKPSPLTHEAQLSREGSPLDRLSGFKTNSPDSTNRYGRVDHLVEESMSVGSGFHSVQPSYQSFDYSLNKYVPANTFRYSNSSSLLLSPEAPPRRPSQAKGSGRPAFPAPLNVVKRSSPSFTSSPSSGKANGKRPKGARPS
ncbi:hypothetical protein LTS18_002391, partial [Coniosporium uncinatum]